MRLKNPNYAPEKTQEQIEMEKSRESLAAFFAKNPAIESVTFDQIREHVGKTEQEWPDGAMHQKLIEWGYDVQP